MDQREDGAKGRGRGTAALIVDEAGPREVQHAPACFQCAASTPRKRFARRLKWVIELGNVMSGISDQLTTTVGNVLSVR